MTGMTELNQDKSLLSMNKSKPAVNVNAYLVLRQENSVLLHLRKNTGYCDGMYGLVSGHVESGEPASLATVRESYEESGISINPSELKAVHVMHRKTNRFNVDIFFECRSWNGKIENKEPEKCGGLNFFPMDRLPENTIGYIAEAISAILRGEFYSENGWEE